jgi:hypothetical protein
MSTQYRLVQSGKTASGGCSAGQGSSEPVAPRIIIIIIIMPPVSFPRHGGVNEELIEKQLHEVVTHVSCSQFETQTVQLSSIRPFSSALKNSLLCAEIRQFIPRYFEVYSQ